MENTELDIYDRLFSLLREATDEELVALEPYFVKEKARRERAAVLVKEINERLYKLQGMMCTNDTIDILCNLTGEVMCTPTDFDYPTEEGKWSAPEVNVRFGK